MDKIDLIIDALEKAQDGWQCFDEYEKALAAARELKALKPVAWMMPDYGDVLSASEADGTGIYNIPLFTAPPKPEQEELIQFKDGKWSYVRKPWVGLTDEEILSAAKEVPITCIRQRDYDLHFAPIIEAKLKEKNNAV